MNPPPPQTLTLRVARARSLKATLRFAGRCQARVSLSMAQRLAQPMPMAGSLLASRASMARKRLVSASAQW